MLKIRFHSEGAPVDGISWNLGGWTGASYIAVEPFVVVFNGIVLCNLCYILLELNQMWSGE